MNDEQDKFNLLLSGLELADASPFEGGRFDALEIDQFSGSFHYVLSFPHVLSYEHRASLSEAIRVFHKKTFKRNNTLTISIHYDDSKLSSALLSSYFTHILDENLFTDGRLSILKQMNAHFADGEATFYAANPAECELLEESFTLLRTLFARYDLAPVFKSSVSPFESPVADAIKARLAKGDREAEAQQAIYEAANGAGRSRSIKKPRLKAGINRPAVSIKSIPISEEELVNWKELHGNTDFVVVGTIGDSSIQTLSRSKAMLYNATLYDGTDSIKIKTFINQENRDAELKYYKNHCADGATLRVYGFANYDRFANDIVLRIIDSAATDEQMPFGDQRHDLEPVKRIELHAHSKYSTLDGLIAPDEYAALAASWGWDAIALTDHNSLQGLPYFADSCKEHGLKPIFGVEASYLPDDAIAITWGAPSKKSLAETVWTVFDVETTGLHPHLDDIIEISAVRITNGMVVKEFDSFVHSDRTLSPFILSLTHIKQTDVQFAPKAEQVFSDFLAFAAGSVLVAHNARFDVACLKEMAARLGKETPDFPVLDTLALSRALHPDYKAYNLDALAKKYSVALDNHHRANADALATGLIFVKMLDEIAQKKISSFADVNDLVRRDPISFYKKQSPFHLVLLAKNHTGQVNLNKMLTDAMTVHLGREPLLLKSVLCAHRDGILVGSACANGEVMNALLSGNDDDVLEAMSFYDYIEVQTPDSYAYLFENSLSAEETTSEIERLVKRLVRLAREAGKPVIATGDAHVLHPEDVPLRQAVISRPMVGGGLHELAGKTRFPAQVLLTTGEMLAAFRFLGDDVAHTIVIEASRGLAARIEEFPLFPKTLYNPKDDFLKDFGITSCAEYLKVLAYSGAKALYGDPLPRLVADRLDKETGAIIKHGYSTIYVVAEMLVKKSTESGYVVGSRGSVGSSLVAYFMGITEVNSLPAHYVCPKCHFTAFKLNAAQKLLYPLDEKQQAFDAELQKQDTGFDLPDATCPVCGARLDRSGVDIPFETFLGFKGDKTPDIDLNFSGDVQAEAHEFIRKMFGRDRAFRAGTITTMADTIAYGYIQGYAEDHGLRFRRCEMDRLAKKLVGIKRSTGTHPGGIVVVPKEIEATDIIPVQYPADDPTSGWLTTHYDYHTFESNLLKFDILGHDDPTMIRFLMNDVEAHPDRYPFHDVPGIPLADPAVLSLFSSCRALSIEPQDIGGEALGVIGLPEFGTENSRKLLNEALPRTVADLIKVAGLSHGTDVWTGNARDLFLGTTEKGYDKVPFEQLIGCRDDIMKALIGYGLEPSDAFWIMEKVRKGHGVEGDDGKGGPGKRTALMREHAVPEWYIDSCNKIQYMYPKAHAAAYVIMGLRIGWFKVHSPLVYYAGFFSRRCDAYDMEAMLGGHEAIDQRLHELQEKTQNRVKLTTKEAATMTPLLLAREMTARGYAFRPISLVESDWRDFQIVGNSLVFPFRVIDSLGDAMARSITDARKEREFTSVQDFMNRTNVTRGILEKLQELGVFEGMPQDDQLRLF